MPTDKEVDEDITELMGPGDPGKGQTPGEEEEDGGNTGGGGTPTPPTYDVDPGESIQDAIDAADYGDTITIANGTYTEYLVLSKGVKLLGASTDGVVINGFIHLETGGTSLSNATVISEMSRSWTDTNETLPAHGLAISGEGSTLRNFDLQVSYGSSGSSAYDIYVSGDHAQLENVSIDRPDGERVNASLFVDEANGVNLSNSEFYGQIGSFAAANSSLTITNTSISTPATDKIWIAATGYEDVPAGFVANVENVTVDGNDVEFVATTFTEFLKFYT